MSNKVQLLNKQIYKIIGINLYFPMIYNFKD